MIREDSSFRDPDGFVFSENGIYYRAIRPSFQSIYESQDFKAVATNLINKSLMVDFIERRHLSKSGFEHFLVIEPEQIPVISYPYEWCFGQFKDAALLTLRINLEIISKGFLLKDATPYNVQFLNSKPILIDTLSLRPYKEGHIWYAYEQFCKMFLGPLLLMRHVNERSHLALKDHIDGIPLSLVSKQLPLKSWFQTGALFHIHLQAAAQGKHESDTKVSIDKIRSKKNINVRSLLEDLYYNIERLSLPQKAKRSIWGRYYEKGVHNYKESAFLEKEQTVNEFLDLVSMGGALKSLDVGTNSGHFTRKAHLHKKIACSVGIDNDMAPLDENYLHAQKHDLKDYLPLLQNMTSPSPGIGWEGRERKSFFARFQPNVILALAVIHHLVISHGIPFELVASYFAKIGQWLIIEFPTEQDSQIPLLIKNIEKGAIQYTQAQFEHSFEKTFTMIAKRKIAHANRIIYLFKTKRSQEVL